MNLLFCVFAISHANPVGSLKTYPITFRERAHLYAIAWASDFKDDPASWEIARQHAYERGICKARYGSYPDLVWAH